MNHNEVRLAFARIRDARRRWATAKAKFDSDVDAAMTRLIHEAALNRMSAEDVANYSGFTLRAVRVKMRQNQLTGRGRNLLARQAAHNLEQNAAILGIEPKDMDLMSPLAYLPAGPELRKAQTTGTGSADDLDGFLETDDALLAGVLKQMIGDQDNYTDLRFGGGELLIDGYISVTLAERDALVRAGMKVSE